MAGILPSLLVNVQLRDSSFISTSLECRWLKNLATGRYCGHSDNCWHRGRILGYTAETTEPPSMDLAERIRRVFSSRGLTLYRVSRNSSEVFGHASRFHIPHNFYDSIAEPSFLPSLHQMLALSHITSYRLADWLAVFGIALDDIPRLQLLLPRKRTTLLDASVYDSSAWVPWVAERPRQGDLPPIAPLSQLLAMTFPRRASDLMG
ncbi:MAG: hypothetical protein WA853_20040, partial [Candidatus Acidiferrum sp.]